MSLIALIVALVIIGLVLWLVNMYIPMDGKIKAVLNVAVVIAVVLWLLYVFGALGSQSHMQIGNMHLWWWNK